MTTWRIVSVARLALAIATAVANALREAFEKSDATRMRRILNIRPILSTMAIQVVDGVNQAERADGREQHRGGGNHIGGGISSHRSSSVDDECLQAAEASGVPIVLIEETSQLPVIRERRVPDFPHRADFSARRSPIVASFPQRCVRLSEAHRLQI